MMRVHQQARALADVSIVRPGNLTTHPLIAIMRGEIGISSDAVPAESSCSNPTCRQVIPKVSVWRMKHKADAKMGMGHGDRHSFVHAATNAEFVFSSQTLPSGPCSLGPTRQPHVMSVGLSIAV
jgi:hypothetical protein